MHNNVLGGLFGIHNIDFCHGLYLSFCVAQLFFVCTFLLVD